MWILSTTFFLLFLQSEMDITKRVQLSSFITKVVPTLGHYFSPLDSKVQYLCTFDLVLAEQERILGEITEGWGKWVLSSCLNSFSEIANCKSFASEFNSKQCPLWCFFGLTNQLTTLLLKVEQASKCDWSTLGKCEDAAIWQVCQII